MRLERSKIKESEWRELRRVEKESSELIVKRKVKKDINTMDERQCEERKVVSV